MKKNKTDELIQILSSSKNFFQANALAKMLGVSERTIRNYINTIKNDSSFEIETSKNGYRIITSGKSAAISSSVDRTNYILSKLLYSKNGISVFDEAEELCVSESTLLNSVIPEIKKLISDFDLKIESKNYQYYLTGKEQNKRKLIGYLVTHNSYGYFTSIETIQRLFPNFDISDSMQNLYNVCQNYNLFFNNYALNNLLVHLLIIILRLDLNDNLASNDNQENIIDLLNTFEQKNEIISLANDISQLFETKYDQKIPTEDYNQILVLIALSVDHEYSHIDNIIDENFTKTIQGLISQLSKRYGIDDFDSDFIVQFSLHMYNAKQRVSFRLSYPNPIANQIKKDYAPIYDMAVYFAHIFCNEYKLSLSEDEIAFIAFHMGSYLENHKNNKRDISAVIVVENYHNFSKKLISEIQSTFGKEMIVTEVLPLNKFLVMQPKCDLIITTMPIDTDHKHVVFINPILTKQNSLQIWNEIESIEEENKQENAQAFLKSLLHPELYFRNVNLNSKNDYIRFMGDKCTIYGYITPEFINDVLLRESLSSTAFTDCLAIPHAISQYADRSFICVIHNDKPIPWGSKNVNFILLIGITEVDMKYFGSAFDLIVELFYSSERALELLKTDTFEEFYNQI